jgi:hypothetical protein
MPILMEHTWKPTVAQVERGKIIPRYDYIVCINCGYTTLRTEIPIPFVSVSCDKWYAKRVARRILGKDEN